MEADAPGEAVDVQGAVAEQLREGAADDATQHFQLKGPVLSVAETDAEMRIVLIASVQGRNPPAIAADGQLVVQGGDSQRSPRPGQALAQEEAKEQAAEIQRIAPCD